MGEEARNISKSYDPKVVEEKWYKIWEEGGYFHQDAEEPGEPYSIVMPPPNVTGTLHLGHALDNTLQDILARVKRMQGYNTLWLPGTDHAGIATQAKVEELLRSEGTNKYELGRERFLERAWEWKEKYGNTITTQLRKLGTSCDWQRERFTMDEGCSEAVKEVFVGLYEKGLIYQGNYIINWCPQCLTTISDIEVEHQEKTGYFYYFKYPIQGENDYLEIATTRPETMLGDTAVAVNPKDPRFCGFIGKNIVLPLVGRIIPIVADDYVDMEFGTGAVKITPAHDPNDFEIGKRHNLPEVKVMEPNGTIVADYAPYAGMDRHVAREKIVEDMKAAGLFLRREEITHSVGHCYRCDTSVEPFLSKQWFVKMQPLADPAIQVVKSGELRFVPERFTGVYLNWLENIRDWCISRQLWWGHRIPVWYCDQCGEVICQTTDPDRCPACSATELRQDPDVLDTWFSSGLWPFSTLGWPENTPDLAKYYPTSVLVTGRDIIFFWVARMIFTSLEFMKEIPFKDVFIHGLVLDGQGRKMSKSLGNGIDPLEVIEKYGADTLRFMLITGNTPGNDIRFQFERLDAASNFANKIWNASRFVMMNLADFPENGTLEALEARQNPGSPNTPGAAAPLDLADRWILSRLHTVSREVNENIDRYELGEAGRKIYEFIWNEFCDWYIEIAKISLNDKTNPAAREKTQIVLRDVLKGAMELLHPIMPFITEEIWQHLPGAGETIMRATYPKGDPARIFPAVEEEMQLYMDVVRGIRNIRSEMNVPPGKKATGLFYTEDGGKADLIARTTPYLKALAALEDVQILAAKEGLEDCATVVVKGIEVFLPLADLIDFAKEVERLEKEAARLAAEVDRIDKKLGNQGFVAKAPADVIEKEKEKRESYQTDLDLVQKRLEGYRK